MRKILVIFVSLLAMQSLPAQELNHRRSYNNFFAEAWGVTGYYSINYERILWRSKNNIFLTSASVGYYNLAYKGVRHIRYPMRVMFCVGKRRVFGEVGYDLLLGKNTAQGLLHPWTQDGKSNYLHLGIRYQPLHNGLYVRAYVFAIPLEEFAVPMPIKDSDSSMFYHLDKDYWSMHDAGKKNLWWGGIGIGWSFGR